MRSRDTPPGAHRVQIEVYRRMTPGQRVQIGAEMSQAAIQIQADGVASRHPDYDEATVAWAVNRLRLGDELFSRVWPGAPLVRP